MLRKYETLFIVKPDLPEEEMETIKTRASTAITTKAGLEIVLQDWGKKRLAYPIRKHLKGNFVYLRYLSTGDSVDELERNLRVLDPVLRYITVKLDDRVDPETFDFEGEAATIFPFNVKPREVVAPTPKPEEAAADAAKGEGTEGAAADSKPTDTKDKEAPAVAEDKPVVEEPAKVEPAVEKKPATEEKPEAPQPKAEEPKKD
jgi:small subunit ribosomal protein S6